MVKDKYNPYRKPPIQKRKLPEGKPREIVPRSVWRAEPPRPFPETPLEPTKLPVENVILTYNTVADRCQDPETCMKSLRRIQQYHMSRGLADIPYNFIVGGDIKIYEGRGWNLKPEIHDKFPEIHDNAIEIAFIGNYLEADLEEMNQLIAEAMQLVDLGVQAKNVTHLFRIKESSPKLRLETMGEDERPWVYEKYPKGDIDIHEPFEVKDTMSPLM